MFKITSGKGFHMTFSNGWTISVQFGTFNYCEARNRYEETYAGNWHPTIEDGLADKAYASEGSETAEVAVWYGTDGEMIRLTEWDTVAGWVSADKVGDAIAWLSNTSVTDPTIVEIELQYIFCENGPEVAWKVVSDDV